jgi:hypothetical protein
METNPTTPSLTVELFDDDGNLLEVFELGSLADDLVDIE